MIMKILIKLNEEDKSINISNTDSIPDEVLKVAPWLKNTEIKNVSVLIDGNKIKWNTGIFLLGIWENGIWENGIFVDGTWKDGIFKNGIWKKGVWEDGTFETESFWESGSFNGGSFKGIWESGYFDGGIFDGGLWLNGTWKSGTWKDGIWKTGKIYSSKFDKLFQSYISPNEFKKLEEKSGSSVNLIAALEETI